MSVLRQSRESQHLTQLMEENVIRAGQRLSEVHPLTVADVEFCVWGDDAFLQGGQCHYRLESRARCETAGKRQLLINDTEHTSSIRVHDDQAAVPVAQSRQSGLAHGGIVADGVVFRRRLAEGAETVASVAAQPAPTASSTDCYSACGFLLPRGVELGS